MSVRNLTPFIVISMAPLIGVAVLIHQRPTMTIQIPAAELVTPAILTALCSSVLALVLERVPEFKEFFDSFNPSQKRLFMAICCTLITLAIGTINLITYGFNANALVTLALSLFTALTSNQTTHSFTKLDQS